MNTTELNGTEYTVTEGYSGKITLTPIITQPEQRKPEAGDVWEGCQGAIWLINPDGIENAVISSGGAWYSGETNDNNESFVDHADAGTYLGKHHEVYVKISDVREALSHKDIDGDGMLDYINTKNTIYGGDESFKALRKLNIITD